MLQCLATPHIQYLWGEIHLPMAENICFLKIILKPPLFSFLYVFLKVNSNVNAYCISYNKIEAEFKDSHKKLPFKLLSHCEILARV